MRTSKKIALIYLILCITPIPLALGDYGNVGEPLFDKWFGENQIIFNEIKVNVSLESVNWSRNFSSADMTLKAYFNGRSTQTTTRINMSVEGFNSEFLFMNPVIGMDTFKNFTCALNSDEIVNESTIIINGNKTADEFGGKSYWEGEFTNLWIKIVYEPIPPAEPISPDEPIEEIPEEFIIIEYDFEDNSTKDPNQTEPEETPFSFGDTEKLSLTFLSIGGIGTLVVMLIKKYQS